jgi:acyl carrier protein phosphodiesterase
VNFLAHCLIGNRAGSQAPNDPLVAGGFLGDFIKGRVPSEMPAPLAQGVRLHRRVDAYSNQHPGIRASCDRFPTELRRIAPILVDIIGDHLLALRWSAFHADHLETFTATTYATIAAHGDWLPPSGHRFLGYARAQDLFARYRDWAVVDGAMRSITRRLGRTELDPALETAVPELLVSLEEDFLGYFPDILVHAADWVASDDG